MSSSPALRLLIADDHQLFAHALRAVLSSDTLEVVGIATSGLEAVEQTLKLSPDVLLLDLGMPGSDGFEALELLRQCRSKARTIVLSAVDEPESRRRAIELGALAFVSKAQPLDELSSALETAAALIRAIDSQLDDA